jgi:hypothetical protein
VEPAAIVEAVSRAVTELLGRAAGPMHFRLVMQPVVASVLAIRAGIRDAREGRPAFFWTFLTNKEERKILLQSGWKDIGKVLILAIVLDVIYQFIVFHTFHPLQTIIVAVGVAVVPYILLRGPVTRIVRAVGKPAPLTPAPKH